MSGPLAHGGPGEPVQAPRASLERARDARLPDGWLDWLVTALAFLATVALILWGPLGQ